MSERLPKPDAADHWSVYWAGGPLTSLPEDFAANYDGEIAEFWHGIFADLPQPATMLDACTGNGALALLAAGFSCDHDHNLAITAVDAARVDPRLAAASSDKLKSLLSQISFVDRTPIEQFEAAPASLDLIGSHYGLEYCDPNKVADRLVRMLKPGGRLVLLTHALASDMLKTMRGEALEYRRLDELRVNALLRAWLSGQLASSDFRRRLQRAGEALIADYRRNRSALFQYVLAMVRHVVTSDEQGLRQAQQALLDAHRQLSTGEARLADMLAANERLAAPDWYRPYLQAGLTLIDEGSLRYKRRHHVGNFYVFALSA